MLGGLFENLVALELRTQASWSGQPISLGHWRQGTDEVDQLLIAADGRVIGIEVKAAKSVSPSDASGLRALGRRLGDRLVAGFVVYTGGGSFPLGDAVDRLWALPVTALWPSDAGQERARASRGPGR